MKMKQIQYRADPVTASSLKTLAEQHGTSVNALIDASVQRFLDQEATKAFARWAETGGAEQSTQLRHDHQAVLEAYAADSAPSGGELGAP